MNYWLAGKNNSAQFPSFYRFNVVNINSQINFPRNREARKFVKNKRKKKNVARILNKYILMRIYSKRLETCLHKDNCEISFENFLLFYLLFFRLSLWKLSNWALPSHSNYVENVSLFLSLSCLLSLRFMKSFEKRHLAFKTWFSDLWFEQLTCPFLLFIFQPFSLA